MRVYRQQTKRRQDDQSRGGTATVELALTAPVFLVMMLGAIDVGQFVNVNQVVSNASREGARVACKFDTTNTATVQTAVENYLAAFYPGQSSASITVATTVSVTDGAGTPVAGGDITTIPEGDAVRVVVSFQFDTVRWMTGMAYLTGQNVTTITIMRRQ